MKINNVLFVRIVMGFGAMEVLNIYSKRSSSSFTPSDLSIVVSAAFTFLSLSLSCVLNNYIGLDYPFCSDEKSLLVLHSLFLGCLFITTNIYLIRVYIGREYRLFIYCILMYGITGTYLVLVKTSSSEPIYWLYSYLTQTEQRVRFLTICSKWSNNKIFTETITCDLVNNYCPDTCFYIHFYEKVKEKSFKHRTKSLSCGYRCRLHHRNEERCRFSEILFCSSSRGIHFPWGNLIFLGQPLKLIFLRRYACQIYIQLLD